MEKLLHVTHRYDDIIDLPHHTSSTRPRMSIQARAAQFAPFAALSGHASALQETARLTDSRVELTEDEIGILDSRLRLILARGGEHPLISVCYFKPDTVKAGGAYVTVTDCIVKIDELSRTLVLESGIIVPIENIVKVNSDIIRDFWD